MATTRGRRQPTTKKPLQGTSKTPEGTPKAPPQENLKGDDSSAALLLLESLRQAAPAEDVAQPGKLTKRLSVAQFDAERMRLAHELLERWPEKGRAFLERLLRERTEGFTPGALRLHITTEAEFDRLIAEAQDRLEEIAASGLSEAEYKEQEYQKAVKAKLFESMRTAGPAAWEAFNARRRRDGSYEIPWDPACMDEG